MLKLNERHLPKGSIVRYTEIKTIDEGTETAHTCLMIHFTDTADTTDCSPYRILQVVLDSAEGYDGLRFNSYKDLKATEGY